MKWIILLALFVYLWWATEITSKGEVIKASYELFLR